MPIPGYCWRTNRPLQFIFYNKHCAVQQLNEKMVLMESTHSDLSSKVYNILTGLYWKIHKYIDHKSLLCLQFNNVVSYAYSTGLMNYKHFFITVHLGRIKQFQLVPNHFPLSYKIVELSWFLFIYLRYVHSTVIDMMKHWYKDV